MDDAIEIMEDLQDFVQKEMYRGNPNYQLGKCGECYDAGIEDTIKLLLENNKIKL